LVVATQPDPVFQEKNVQKWDNDSVMLLYHTFPAAVRDVL